MTEDEAKKKWCPFAREPQSLVAQSEFGPPFNFSCIGSRCMAWRWDEPRYEYAATENVKHGVFDKIISPEGEGWERAEAGTVEFHRSHWRRELPRTSGHCGIAGAL